MARSFDVVRTERLELRRVAEGDIPALVVICTDPRTNEHRPGGAPSVAEERAICRRFIADWERDGIGYWTVRLDGEIVGVSGVMAATIDGRELFNLYYRYAPDVWGRGIAAEAGRAALDAATRHSPHRPVVARTRPSNEPAIRLALAVGLTRDPAFDGGGLIAYASAVSP